MEVQQNTDGDTPSRWRQLIEGMGVLKVKVISLPYIFQVLFVLCFTRPIYQVSVYRTIGPLVFAYHHVVRQLIANMFLS